MVFVLVRCVAKKEVFRLVIGSGAGSRIGRVEVMVVVVVVGVIGGDVRL